MQEKKRRRRWQDEPEDEPVELGDVLEPDQEPYFQPEESYGEETEAPEYAYDPTAYDETYNEEYSDYHESVDNAARFKIAMGVFDTVSILVGVLVILVLVALLVSLVSWLRSDIMHSVLLLQSGLQ